MSLVEDIELPSPEVMAQRAIAVTGASDEEDREALRTAILEPIFAPMRRRAS